MPGGSITPFLAVSSAGTTNTGAVDRLEFVDGRALRAVHAASADYLPAGTPPETYDPSEHGPDLSRGFPGFRVWLTVKILGATRLRAAIAEKRALAVDAARRITELRNAVTIAPPQLSLFAFYVTWQGATMAAENAIAGATV